MFILTLVQSRCHADTVQTVFDNSTISRHICWSHTMKVLGSHVTSVRRNSVRMVTLRSIYFATQAWSRMFARNVRSVSAHLVNWKKKHKLKHSDLKQFCCCSCGKYFKYKYYVVQHFKRRSVRLQFTGIFQCEWQMTHVCAVPLCYHCLMFCEWTLLLVHCW